MHKIAKILCFGAVLLMMFCSTSVNAKTLPVPALDESRTAAPAESSVVLAGGCFWGIQAVYQHVKGVKQAVSGYSGGEAATAHYNMVSHGNTGHAEAVKVTYDPSQITLGQILQVFFSVAHDPTELNRQGPDRGTEYRSAIFYASEDQKKLAETYIAQLDKAKLFEAPIVTTLEPLKAFYPAEDYHQDFARLNPTNGYIVVNDAPKVAALKKEFPQLYSGE